MGLEKLGHLAMPEFAIQFTPCHPKLPAYLAIIGRRLDGFVRLEQLRLVYQIDVLALEAGPLLGLLVVYRIDEAVPVLFIDEVLVGAVVEARITGFLAELDMLH